MSKSIEVRNGDLTFALELLKTQSEGDLRAFNRKRQFTPAANRKKHRAHKSKIGHPKRKAANYGKD